MKNLKIAVLATMLVGTSAFAATDFSPKRAYVTAPEAVATVVVPSLMDTFDSIVLEGNVSGDFDNKDTQMFNIRINGQKDLGDGIRTSVSVGGDQDGFAADAGVSHTQMTDQGLLTFAAGVDFSAGQFDFVPSIEFIEKDSNFGISYSPLGLGFVEIKDGHKYRYSLDPITNAFQILTGQRTIFHALAEHLNLETVEFEAKVEAVAVVDERIIVVVDGKIMVMNQGANFWTNMDMLSLSDADLEVILEG